MLRINEEAVHTHCHTHQTNLVVAALCSIQYVRNILDQIKELSFFFSFFEPCQKMLHFSIEEHAHGCRVGGSRPLHISEQLQASLKCQRVFQCQKHK